MSTKELDRTEEELREQCIKIQFTTGMDDRAWSAYFGNDEGLYGLVHQHTKAAEDQKIQQVKDLINKLKVKDGKGLHIVGLELLNFELSRLQSHNQEERGTHE